MVPIEVEAAAVKVFAAGAGHDIDCAIARQAGREIKVDGRDLKLLNDLLGHLQGSPDRANEVNVRAVHGNARVSDARGWLKRPAPSTGTKVRLPVVVGLATPGSSLASSRKFRPLSGRFSICLRLTTPPTWCCSDCISGAASRTITFSVISPTWSVRLRLVVVPVSTVAVRSSRLNPSASAVTL